MIETLRLRAPFSATNQSLSMNIRPHANSSPPQRNVRNFLAISPEVLLLLKARLLASDEVNVVHAIRRRSQEGEICKIASMLHVLKSHNPQWEESDIDFNKLPHALSNEVYHVTHKVTGQSVLVRVYLDQHRPESLNRSLSIQVGLLGLGPKILSTCPEGSCEEWITGRTMTHAEMLSEEYIPKLARAIKMLHDAKIVHNDLHHNNVIIDERNCVRLVDFEYAKKDSTQEDIDYDLANHFCEWMYDYGADDWHVPKPLPPDVFSELTNRFLSAYYDPQLLPDGCLERIVSRFHEVHLSWMSWGLAFFNSTQDEKYMEYAVARARLDERVLAPLDNSNGDCSVEEPEIIQEFFRLSKDDAAYN